MKPITAAIISVCAISLLLRCSEIESSRYSTSRLEHYEIRYAVPGEPGASIPVDNGVISISVSGKGGSGGTSGTGEAGGNGSNISWVICPQTWNEHTKLTISQQRACDNLYK